MTVHSTAARVSHYQLYLICPTLEDVCQANNSRLGGQDLGSWRVLGHEIGKLVHLVSKSAL